MNILNHLNTCDFFKDVSVGDVLVIRRKQCKTDILVTCKAKTNDNEIVLSLKQNDYFNFDMYREGESWVWRVWNLGQIKLTAITNTTTPFPR